MVAVGTIAFGCEMKVLWRSALFSSVLHEICAEVGASTILLRFAANRYGNRSLSIADVGGSAVPLAALYLVPASNQRKNISSADGAR